LNDSELEARLRDIGARRYHRLHPFHHLLHGGICTKGQVQAWALNRYYYQAMIPLKDASLIGRCEDEALRREWRKRLDDHDGDENRPGGIERWLKLTDGLGLDREAVTSTRLLLPATRFAVQAYVHYVRERSLLEAVASCLTELFSSQIITERMAGMLAHYDFVTPEIMAYFDKRPPQAERDAHFALAEHDPGRAGDPDLDVPQLRVEQPCADGHPQEAGRQEQQWQTVPWPGDRGDWEAATITA
jgi:coenzyme PQQ biosynthesis protein C